MSNSLPHPSASQAQPSPAQRAPSHHSRRERRKDPATGRWQWVTVAYPEAQR